VSEPEVVVDVVRSGFVESRHTASVLALDVDGAVAFAAGGCDEPIFPRSSNKPLQVVGMLECGLELEGELLALACASHSGEPFHLEGVHRILASAGLDESALQTPPALPVDEVEKVRYLSAGGRPSSIAMNCSGKHAAMLASCVASGWPTETYREPDHPLQQHLQATAEGLAGEPVKATGVDGCGAPLFALSLAGLARAFRALALAGEDAPAGRVAAAIRAYPTWLGGTRRDVSQLIAGVRGLIAKDGAEAVYAAALPDGRAVALKVADGAERARAVVMAAALMRLGVRAEVLDEQLAGPVLGGGEPVGEVRVHGW
jgi:L-asparaginase II